MVGHRLLCYRILHQLNHEESGEVYLAEDTRHDRQVALKLLPDAACRDPVQLACLWTAAETAARLTHPHIARIYGIEKADPETGDNARSWPLALHPRVTDAGDASHTLPPQPASQPHPVYLIAMEYVDGQPLRALVSRNGLSLDQFFSWFIPVADALCYAHEHGVMHRTLNIGHMVIARDGCPKILDFGLSPAITYDAHEENEKAASKPFIRINTIPEMPPHLSPEQ